MGSAETTGNGAETVSDAELSLLRIEAHLDELGRKVDHVDEQVHSLVRLIDEHRPLLARAASLADPGAKVRAMLHPRKTREDGHE